MYGWIVTFYEVKCVADIDEADYMADIDLADMVWSVSEFNMLEVLYYNVLYGNKETIRNYAMTLCFQFKVTIRTEKEASGGLFKLKKSVADMDVAELVV